MRAFRLVGGQTIATCNQSQDGEARGKYILANDQDEENTARMTSGLLLHNIRCMPY
jgi:hypothetical protein